MNVYSDIFCILSNFFGMQLFYIKYSNKMQIILNIWLTHTVNHTWYYHSSSYWNWDQSQWRVNITFLLSPAQKPPNQMHFYVLFRILLLGVCVYEGGGHYLQNF